MTENKIAQALERLFDKHRIVFWYDSKHELRDDFDSLSLTGITKLEIRNNEYALKHRILREEPEQKFLLYREGPQPEPLDNWLLDVHLAHGEFRTDQGAIWLSELELGPEFMGLVKQHAEFFKAARRKEDLKAILHPEDTQSKIRLKMLAICAGCKSDPRMDTVTAHLLEELADGRDEKIKMIGRFSLDGFLWEQMDRCFGYRPKEPGIRDFMIELFKSCYAMGTDGTIHLNRDALVFLKRWKDSRQFEACFETLSHECSGALEIEQDLFERDFRTLMELDYFRLIDQKIISDLVRAVTERTVTSGDVTRWIRQRRQSHWYKDFHHVYEAVDYASRFIKILGEAKLDMDSMEDGIRKYRATWYKIDQLYRKCIYHKMKSGQASLLNDLSDRIENLYVNTFLLKVNDLFQVFVDQTKVWGVPPLPLQRQFFEYWVRPFLKKENKVCVIISDAMRYEIGDELLGIIRKEDRYSAEMDVVLSMLPSYTQLGMAALLPNTELSIKGDKTASVFVDGLSSQGIDNRSKILGKALEQKATAIKAEDLMGLNKEESRDLFRSHDVLYVYHNKIDDTGHTNKPSEAQAFEAVEQTLSDLLMLIKKLTAANASNILITADHGFIYQHREIEESDFSTAEPEGESIFFRDRRFVLGKGLHGDSSLCTFRPDQLGLVGDIEIQIPKSITRLRLKGSESRFVHGGASLQEVVIPVLKINKKRLSDVSCVAVDILKGTSSKITSGQLAVVLYQKGPVTEKMHPRILRAGIYTKSGDLISDSHELTFDLTSENPRERELPVKFVLSRKADEVNGQDVTLKLEERHADTSHYKEYKSVRYLMHRSFTSDFDV